MAINDSVSDLIARLRNASSATLPQARAPYSKQIEAVLKVLLEEGYIGEFQLEDIGNNRKDVVINIKYHEGEPVIRKMRRISKPGRRVYMSIGSLPRYNNGLGIAILSTSKGIMSDFEARKSNIGGEVLCSVF